MSFDLRQNLLLVRDASLTGKPLFYFYNAMGREMVLTGDVLREIIERQKDGTLCTNTYWGYATDPTLEVWSFDDNNDLILHHRVGKSCNTYLPYEMIASSDPAFKPINGLYIEDNLRRIINIHLKATLREAQKITWFADLPEPEMRSMLLSFGLGPLRIERENKEGLIKLHDRWLEDFDDKHKYTHNAIGLDAAEKIPADYRPERIRDIMDRMMHNTKTQEMMVQTLNDLLRQCRIRGDIPMPGSNFNLHQLVCYYATHLIYAHDAAEKLRSLIDNTQFVVNFIYGMYPDYSWIMVNEETFDYQQSLVRAALISLKRHVENEVGTYKIVHGMVKFADNFDPHTTALDDDEEDFDEEADEEETDDQEKEVIDYLRTKSEDELRKVATRNKMARTNKLKTMNKEELVVLCSDYYGTEMPEDFDEEEVEEKEQERVREPRKFPVVLHHTRYDYDIIHRTLVQIGVIKKNARKPKEMTVAQHNASLLATFRAVVLDPEAKALDSLSKATLLTLAINMTKLKDGDNFSREDEFLKELIKHAVK